MLLLTTLAIVVFGVMMIYSASKGGGYVGKQIVWAIIGVVAGAAVATVNQSVLSRHAGKIYVLVILLLVAVLVLGKEANEATRWLKLGPIQFQPSEFAKIAMIICLAVFLVKRQDEISSTKTFVLSFIYIVPPMALIFKQPDLGTSLVLIAIWFTMVFVMGTSIKNIIATVLVGVVLVGVAWTVPGVIKPYQKKRLTAFLDQDADPQEGSYQVIQARIAIGSGKILGKGFLQGTQRKLSFIPEQHTDFIFTVVGEETGFIGATTLIFLYFIFLWRGLSIVYATEDVTGRAIAAGIVAMFLFHIVVNIGMTLGIMPVTGVPLPMVSAGGSSLLTSLVAVGLLEGISMRRHRINF